MWNTEPVARYGQMAADTAVQYAPKVAIAVVLGFVGWKLAKLASLGLHRLLENRRVDPSLRPFLGSLLDAMIKVALVVSLIGYLGIPTASFVAVIGAAGLSIGLALSGTLQNFAGGVILLLIRPFHVGDTIKAQSFTGKVHAIQIFQTVLLTSDNATVFIPNGKLVNESIANFSLQANRRIELKFGFDYKECVDRSREILLQLIAEDSRILTDPKPEVEIHNLGKSTVDLQTTFWVIRDDHGKVSSSMRERVKKKFEAEGIALTGTES